MLYGFLDFVTTLPFQKEIQLVRQLPKYGRNTACQTAPHPHQYLDLYVRCEPVNYIFTMITLEINCVLFLKIVYYYGTHNIYRNFSSSKTSLFYLCILKATYDTFLK